MLRTLKLMIILLLFQLTFGVVSYHIQEIVLKQDSQLKSHNINIEGSYRLRLPKVPFTIKDKKLILTLCNTHTFRIDIVTPPNQIKLILETSTQKACTDSIDAQYIALSSSITSYTFDGTRMDFFKNGESIAFATRQYKEQNNNKIRGKWQLQLSNLPIQVSANTLQFTGCNVNSFKYKITGGSINITPQYTTLILCNVDNDSIFSKALVRGKRIKVGEVKFDLYTKGGELTAYTTPYVN